MEARGYIINNEFTQKCELGIHLFENSLNQEDLTIYQTMVSEVYELTKDIWRGVWQSAAQSAAIGGVITTVVSTTRVLNN